MKQILSVLLITFIANSSFGQGTVEAEFDTTFNYQFESLKDSHKKKILIDQSTQHNLFRVIWKRDSA